MSRKSSRYGGSPQQQTSDHSVTPGDRVTESGVLLGFTIPLLLADIMLEMSRDWLADPYSNNKKTKNMSYLFFSAQRLDLDTVFTGFIVMGMLASLALVAVSYLLADGNLSDLLLKAGNTARATLTIAETMATKAVPIISTATGLVGTLATKGAGIVDSFVTIISSKLLSGLETLAMLLKNILTVVTSKVAAWAQYVGGQLASLLTTALKAAANVAKDFLLKFVELVKGFFIPVI